jgi:hypothetical protein
VEVDNTAKVTRGEQCIQHTINKKSVCYLHEAAGFPVQETLIDAIKAGNYTTWPGITVKTVNQHFPESDETQKGHMKNNDKLSDQRE